MCRKDYFNNIISTGRSSSSSGSSNSASSSTSTSSRSSIDIGSVKDSSGESSSSSNINTNISTKYNRNNKIIILLKRIIIIMAKMMFCNSCSCHGQSKKQIQRIYSTHCKSRYFTNIVIEYNLNLLLRKVLTHHFRTVDG